MSKTTAWNAFNQAKVECGLFKTHPEMRIHTLRHSYATHLLESGVHIKQLSTYLGHNSLKPTLVYLHLTELSDAQARAALQTLALCKAHYRAVRSVLTCRTPAMGGRLYRCQNTACGRPHFAYHSCNHRNCPRCGARDQQLWTAKQEAALLPVSYFLITFTIPSELRSLCLQYPKELYDRLLKESAGALTDVVASKLKSPSARLGLTSVLHTWGRQMQHHPHVHIIMPAVAFDEKENKLIYPKNKNAHRIAGTTFGHLPDPRPNQSPFASHSMERPTPTCGPRKDRDSLSRPIRAT